MVSVTCLRYIPFRLSPPPYNTKRPIPMGAVCSSGLSNSSTRPPQLAAVLACMSQPNFDDLVAGAMMATLGEEIPRMRGQGHRSPERHGLAKNLGESQ